MATARVERRLSAILAADVVGYSRLMERDEAGTFERLKRLRKDLIEPVLERYGGRFVDLRGGFHNSLATRPATRKMHAAWSSDWMMKPRRS